MTDSSTALMAVPSPATYRLEPSRSTVQYSGKHMFGLCTVHLTFRVRDGELVVGESLAAPRATVTVDAASFSSNNAKRDKDV